MPSPKEQAALEQAAFGAAANKKKKKRGNERSLDGVANFITFSVAPQIAYVEVSFIATTIHLAKEGVVCVLPDRFES